MIKGFRQQFVVKTANLNFIFFYNIKIKAIFIFYYINLGIFYKI